MVFRTRLVTAAGVDPAVALTEEVDGCLMVGFKKVGVGCMYEFIHTEMYMVKGRSRNCKTEQ